MTDHVVMVAFAGGVRQQESILRRYVDDSQGEPYPGNIMYNLLSGKPPWPKSSTAPGSVESTPFRPSSRSPWSPSAPPSPKSAP